MKRLFTLLLVLGALTFGIQAQADTDVDVDSNSTLDALFGGTNRDTSGDTGFPYITAGVWAVSAVDLTEFEELKTIGTTTLSANQWLLLGGLAETLTSAEVNILDGVSGVTAAELSYVASVTSDIQTQLDARALESVVGTSIGTGLTLDGTVLKAHAALQSIVGLTEADVSVIEQTGADTYNVVTSGGNNYLLGSNSNNTALEFKTPANVLTQIGGEVDLVNEAGLYAVLSDVTLFLEDLVDDTTPQLGGPLDLNNKVVFDAANAFGAGDATPDVSGGTVFKTADTTTITDFDDGDDHGDFQDGRPLVILAQHAGTLDFSSSQLNGHGDVDYTMADGDIIICFFDETTDADGQWVCMVPGPKSLENVTIGGFTASRAVEIDGSGNLIASLVTSTELALLDAMSKSGSDTNFITGTAGTDTYCAVWNADGDLVDGPGVPYVVGGTDVADADIVPAITRDTEVPGMTSTTPGVIFCFNLHDPDDTMDYIKKQFPRAMTITKVTMKCDGGTNVIGRLYEVDGDGDGSDKVGIETSDWTVTTTETEDTSFNNGTLDAGDYLSWYTTSVSGAVVNCVVTVEGHET